MKLFVANFAFQVGFDACAHCNQITGGLRAELTNDLMIDSGGRDLSYLHNLFQRGSQKILDDSHVVLLPTNRMSSSASANTEIMLITSLSFGLPGGPDISMM